MPKFACKVTRTEEKVVLIYIEAPDRDEASDLAKEFAQTHDQQLNAKSRYAVSSISFDCFSKECNRVEGETFTQLDVIKTKEK